ncbi:hypothetical protein [Thiohalophilus thiocyanatoxydans]|uniref:Heparinase II/III-like protein n=1 Tax=Thiohalophilus thiocyanatoxydans TaxID=381308 RepID=A0A4R8ISZ8_9GAMM|nr:hypothetical protein [Thiohalophilus thiocyanatoxydans]TDY03758.1 hypothetical protein EDC23_0128 [Thiohalophilus thiocyanatoxydans]
MNPPRDTRIDSRLDERLASLTGALQQQIKPDGTLWDPQQGKSSPVDHYAQISTALALYLRQPADPLVRRLIEHWLAQTSDQRGHAPFNRFLLLLLRETWHNHDEARSAIDASLITESLSRCPLARRYPSNNWTLLAQLCRIMEATSKKQRAQATGELGRMLDRWTMPAGGFVDFPGHAASPGSATPMAYHHKALFVTTMALHYTRSSRLMGHLQRLHEWVLLCWDGQTHVGGFGRSTHSLFGDACLLASLILSGCDKQQPSQSTGSQMITGILKRWSGQCRDDDLLALNPAGQQGWDSYMYLSVYNAWTAAIVGWARHVATSDAQPVINTQALEATPAFRQDADAGLLRIGTDAGLVALLSTRGQRPQGFSRDAVELRYAGGVPFHVARRDQLLCPASTRIKATRLLAQPALAGWTPVFLIDGILCGLTEYTHVQIEETDAAYRITLAGSPLPLLRPADSTAWQRLKAAIDWRFLDGALGRRAVLQRRPARQVQARLVISLSRHKPELIHELTLEPIATGRVRYLNPAGHALIANALPRTRELESSSRDKTRTTDAAFHDTTLDSAIPGASGYCLAEQTIGEEGYRHRLVLQW